MNTLMYEHPLTNEHLRIIRDIIGYQVVGPIGKTLACGDVGKYMDQTSRKCVTERVSFVAGLGAMTEWRDIVHIVVEKFSLIRRDPS